MSGGTATTVAAFLTLAQLKIFIMALYVSRSAFFQFTDMLAILFGVAVLGGACAPVSSTTSKSYNCSALTGKSWVPSVTGASSSNHNSATTVTSTTTTAMGTITGLQQGVSLVSVPIDMTADLGQYGSLTLTAQATDYPSGLQGNAYPVLISLSDGTNEYLNLSTGCTSTGLFACTSGKCSPSSSCSVSWPSAFASTNQWEQHQIPSFGYTTVNTFPTCNWTPGSQTPNNFPQCSFNQVFFPSGVSPARLRSGVTYTAKYALIASNYSSLSGYSAHFTVTATKKATPVSATLGGGLDVNVVIVGTTNINASRTTKGQQNLNTLFSMVYNYYNQASTAVKLGAVNVYEWTCENGGDTFAATSISALGSLFQTGSALLDPSTQGKALNVFLVNTIADDLVVSGGDSSLTVLGLSGAIGGPPVNGTATSGAAFATFSQLATFNSGCTATGNCPLTQVDGSFADMASTITHEMGHYLGLNHPSESAGTVHDGVYDTPICTNTQSIGGTSYITINSCAADANAYPPTGNTCAQVCSSYSATSGTYCPTQLECEFNHIMWWTSKNFTAGSGTGDGNLFSTETGGIINYSPFVQ